MTGITKEDLAAVLTALDTAQAKVDGLTAEVNALKGQVTISKDTANKADRAATKADKSSRRNWHLLIFDLVLSVVSIVGGVYLVLTRNNLNHVQVTQHSACVASNESRAVISQDLIALNTPLIYILVQDLAALKDQQKTLPPANYKRDLTILTKTLSELQSAQKEAQDNLGQKPCK